MDHVAHECDVAKGTLYLYVPSKRGLYLAVLSEGMDDLPSSVCSRKRCSASPGGDAALASRRRGG